MGVHGDVKNPPANEQSPYAPGDNYQETKTQGERLVLEYMRQDKLPLVVFRPTGVYGPGDMRFLKLMKAIKSKMLVVVGSGEVLFHAIYIDDLVEGILRCGICPNAVGNVYILAGDEPVVLNELFRMSAEAIGVRPPWLRVPFTPVYLAGYLCELLFKPLGIDPPLHRRRVNFFKNTRWFDISKAKRELGFQPRMDMGTGLRTVVDWYRANEYL